MKRRGAVVSIALGWLVSSRAQTPGEPAALERIDDLRALATQVRRDRLPLLLFFSTPGCPYCLDVRRGYLAPRIRSAQPGALMREVDITSPRKVTALDGKPISEADLAARFSVRAVPVVLLVDAELRPLGDPLVGIDRSGFYEGYLAAAIESATQRLRR